MSRQTTYVTIIGLLALVLSPIALLLAQDKPDVAKDPTPLAKNLIGAWILVGSPGKVEEPPAAGGRLKFCTGKHWMITQPDATTGVTIFHHGGTYTLDGDEYAETLHYANESTKDMIKETNKFKIKIEGDTLTILGIGNPYNEVWKRLK